ncbi:hypothetical protein GE09DRAFT_1157226 [Coniochaeta sp. 2T2.1]|nr:hypothetical protein GE09DRAFT_1157226 [Coniochaeta sp. 2T2.1]
MTPVGWWRAMAPQLLATAGCHSRHSEDGCVANAPPFYATGQPHFQYLIPHNDPALRAQSGRCGGIEGMATGQSRRDDGIRRASRDLQRTLVYILQFISRRK